MAGRDGWGIQAINSIHLGPQEFYKCDCMPSDWWILWPCSRGWLRHIWMTFSSTGASFISVMWKCFQKCWKNTWFGWEQSLKSWKRQDWNWNLVSVSFFKKAWAYFGHKILENGIEVDNSKTKVIQECPIPKMVTEVRSFLGFTNYYYSFINKYAQVTWPLYKLISGENASKKSKSIEWNDECQEAFRKLKEICTSTPILAYVDFSKPFKLHTDTCTLGLRVILYQSQDGVDHVIECAGQFLSKTEQQYLAHKLEFLALKWAIMEQFHDYLTAIILSYI